MENLFKFIQEQTVVYTHSKNFHADDVFSSALLLLVNPDLRIVRTLDTTKNGFYYDLGLGEYDHHQANATVRPDGTTKYCAFGLLWRDLGKETLALLGCPVKQWDFIDTELVKLIDISDNSPILNPISSTIASFNPQWNEERTDVDFDSKFWLAVQFATKVLIAYMGFGSMIPVFDTIKSQAESSTITLLQGEEFVRTQGWQETKGIYIMPKYAPFTGANLVEELGLMYVLYPHDRGGWAVQNVAKTVNGVRSNTAPLPVAELEARKKELHLHFVHQSGFLATCDTIEDAKRIAKIGLEYYNL